VVSNINIYLRIMAHLFIPDPLGGLKAPQQAIS